MSAKPPGTEQPALVAATNAAKPAAAPNPSVVKGVAQNLMAQPGLARTVVPPAAEQPMPSAVAPTPPEKS